MKTFIYFIAIIFWEAYFLFLTHNGFSRQKAIMEKEYNEDPIKKTDSINDYQEAIKKIAAEIELLKNQYPQLRDFHTDIHADLKGLIISYAYKTHKSKHRAGWVSGVPNPDKQGIWFYIDLHSPDSKSQIHTQPMMPDWCIGEKRVSFLILEGQKTKPISEKIYQILQKHGVVNC